MSPPRHHRRKLPPLASLRAFDSVGRHLSFTKAAGELHITQAAVSRQIRLLEDHLGTALFIRNTRQIALSAAGEVYLPQIQQAFDLIEQATHALTGQRTSVKVSLLSSFAANWLVPRLDDFYRRHPDVHLTLDPNMQPVDVAGGEADLAIRYGCGGWPGTRAQKFMDEELFPVCSPAFAQRHAINHMHDLFAQPALQASMPLDWDVWFTGSGADYSAMHRRIVLQDYNIVVQAALAGQGVAIGRRCLIAPLLAEGKLVRLLDRAVAGIVGYYVILPAMNLTPMAQKFHTWLTNTAVSITPAYQSGHKTDSSPA